MKSILILALAGLCSCSFVSSKVEKWSGLKFQETKPVSSFFQFAWIKNIDPDYETGNLPVALHSPLIKEGVVYAGSNQGYMAAYDLYDGREIWKKTDRGEYHSQPSVYKDWILYGTTEGRFYARDRFTGKIVYAIDLGSPIDSRPVVAKGRVFIHVRGHRLFSLDVETGKILWAYKRSVPFLTTVQRVSDPVVYKDRVFVGFADGFVAALGMEDGVLLWDSKLSTAAKFVDVDMTPVVIKDKLLVGSMASPVHLLDINSGRVHFTLDHEISRTPIRLGKSLVLGTLRGEIVFLNESFKELKKLMPGRGSISSLKLWKNYLVASTVKGYLIFVDSTTLEVKNEYHLGHVNSAVFGKMVEEDGHLVFISSRNRVYAVK